MIGLRFPPFKSIHSIFGEMFGRLEVILAPPSLQHSCSSAKSMAKEFGLPIRASINTRLKKKRRKMTSYNLVEFFISVMGYLFDPSKFEVSIRG